MTAGGASPNVVWHPTDIPASVRAERTGQRGATVWLTGLSGSGKSTGAQAPAPPVVAGGGR
ncbi:MAG: adenylyl-sulfate kinase, partial [Acidimicrobiia bacterium]|nr:adenylyl-sulfate kinase [Acidimicrobiia bacterium]